MDTIVPEPSDSSKTPENPATLLRAVAAMRAEWTIGVSNRPVHQRTARLVNAIADRLAALATETVPHPILGSGPFGYSVYHWCTVVPCRHDGTWPCQPDAEGATALAIARLYLGETA